MLHEFLILSQLPESLCSVSPFRGSKSARKLVLMNFSFENGYSWIDIKVMASESFGAAILSFPKKFVPILRAIKGPHTHPFFHVFPVG